MNAPEKIIDRSQFIGGSDAAAILGVSPWATPLDVFLEKTHQVEREVSTAKEKLFKRGKRLEPIAVDMLIEDLGVKVTKRSTPQNPNRYSDPEHPFLAAEIDFEWEVTAELADLWDLDRSLIGTIQSGEIKTVHHFATAKFGDAESEEVPVEYAAQAMHGLMVAGRKLTLFGVLVGADNLSIYWIKRDDDTIREMRRREVAFWNDNVLAGVAPAPVNLPDMLALFNKVEATEIEATEEIFGLVAQLDDLKATVKGCEEGIEEMKFKIGVFMLGEEALKTKDKAGKHTLTFGRTPLLTVALQSQTRIDNDKLRKDHPAIAAACSKQTQFFTYRSPRKK